MRKALLGSMIAMAILAAPGAPECKISASNSAVLSPRSCGESSRQAPVAAALNVTPSGPLLMADRTETDDYIQYRSDSEPIPTPRELESRERQKEERSWQMLERVEIFEPIRKKRPARKNQSQQ